MNMDYIQHPDILLENLGNGWWAVRLNRPKALHALDADITLALHSMFEHLHHREDVRAIWFDSTTPKAFCAGGDVRALRQHILANNIVAAEQFFSQEYALDKLLHHYAKPVVVWGEGFVMGGGLGLFMASPFRLVTPQSRLAMPEINIGLYPDAGGTRFLADRGTIGLFIGLTGAIMTAAGGYSIGWATHICAWNRDQVLQRLTSIAWHDYPAGDFRAIDDTLNSLHRPVPAGPLQKSLQTIEQACRGEDFLQDYQAISQLMSHPSDWLRQAAENLAHGSPTTAALTWLLWQWAKTLRSWDEVFQLEHEISMWKVQHSDFVEGVRARLVDKDLQPQWQVGQIKHIRDAFVGYPPVSQTVKSWNDVLKRYGVI
ncbi:MULTISPECIES: enoyl-CoA hydratase/isomerase family protein [unclassified Acinetobacter]|uniref:enoyl-CoA hydratase/isomerase family protein n=1 Tax=unclassified Acinetobacter TaxID=196816 RepID=UPI0035B83E79